MFHSIFPNAKNSFNDFVWTSDATFLQEPIILPETFVCCHVDMGQMTEITDFQQISRGRRKKKNTLKSLRGKHRNNPHGKLEPMMKNASFDVLQRQIKCGNNIAQIKFLLQLYETTSIQDYILCEVKSKNESIANVLPWSQIF